MVAALLRGSLASGQDSQQLYREGIRLLTAGQTGAAAEMLRKSVALRPANAPAWKALGVVLASQGKTEDAEPAFRNACERDPSLEDACLYYGRVLYLLDRLEPALEALRQAVKIRDTGEARRLQALSLEALGRGAEAETEFRTAIRLGGSGSPDEDPGIDYGVFLYRQGRVADAVPPLESALQRHPDSARAHLELGCLLLALDRLSEAASHLERSLILKDSPRAHQLLAKAYLRMGKTELAEPHLKK